MSALDELLDRADIPRPARQRICGLIASAELPEDRALEVARELVAHFEDGLAAGRTIDDLLASFGDERLVAGLIGGLPRRPRAAMQPMAHRGRGDFPLVAIGRNLRYALRRMAQSPSFTAIAILSLALGIGANTAIFSLVNAAILRELPVPAPEELVEIYTFHPDLEYNIFSYPDYRDLRDASDDVFASVSVSGYAFASIDVADGVEMAAAEVVTGDYFSQLGVRPEVGRLIGPEDDVALGAHPVVVLGNGYWQRAHGADPGVVGETLRVNGLEYTVIGVVPEWYTGNLRALIPDLYFSVMMINQLQPGLSDRLEQRDGHWLFAKGRLGPGITLETAAGRLDAIAADLKRTYPESWQENDRFFVLPSSEVVLFPPVDRFIVPVAGVFMSLVGLVLLVACANLASFLLARAMDRQKEIAVRLAIGATRRSIVAQLFTETFVLALAGGAAGVLVAVYLLRLLFAVDLPLPFPVSVDVGVDATLLGFSLLASIAAGLFFGVVPALQGTHSDVAATLKEGGSGAGRPGRVWMRNALVVAQVAFCLVLLVAAGLFVRSARATQAVDPGFGRQPAGLLTMVVPGTRYDVEQGRRFVDRLRSRIAELPGVDAVGAIDSLHLNSLNIQTFDFTIDGVEPPPGTTAHVADRATVDAGFFDAAGVRLLEGRTFVETDTASSAFVAIVSDAFAERFWPGESALGRVIHQPGDEPDLLVVGVARDAKVRTLAEAPRPFIYMPYSQHYSSVLTLVARTSVDAEVTARAMLAAGRELDPELLVLESKTVQRHIDIMLLPARLAAFVLTAFAALTLLLASIGLYGVVSYAVAQRTREVGIRLSLGADHGAVVRMLTAGGMKLVAAGSLIGVVLAAIVSRAMALLLFGVEALDPVTFGGVTFILLFVALFAAWLPARRASRVDPVRALRAE